MLFIVVCQAIIFADSSGASKCLNERFSRFAPDLDNSDWGKASSGCAQQHFCSGSRPVLWWRGNAMFSAWGFSIASLFIPSRAFFIPSFFRMATIAFRTDPDFETILILSLCLFIHILQYVCWFVSQNSLWSGLFLFAQNENQRRSGGKSVCNSCLETLRCYGCYNSPVSTSSEIIKRSSSPWHVKGMNQMPSGAVYSICLGYLFTARPSQYIAVLCRNAET